MATPFSTVISIAQVSGQSCGQAAFTTRRCVTSRSSAPMGISGGCFDASILRHEGGTRESQFVAKPRSTLLMPLFLRAEAVICALAQSQTRFEPQINTDRTGERSVFLRVYPWLI